MWKRTTALMAYLFIGITLMIYPVQVSSAATETAATPEVVSIERGQVPPHDAIVNYIEPLVYCGQLYYINTENPHFHLALGSTRFALKPVNSAAEEDLQGHIPQNLLPLEPGESLDCGQVMATGYGNNPQLTSNTESEGPCAQDTELRLLKLKDGISLNGDDYFLGNDYNGLALVMETGKHLQLSQQDFPNDTKIWCCVGEPNSTILCPNSVEIENGYNIWSYNTVAAGLTTLVLEYKETGEKLLWYVPKYSLNFQIVSPLDPVIPPPLAFHDGVTYDIENNYITLYRGYQTAGYEINIEQMKLEGETLTVGYSLDYPTGVAPAVKTYPSFSAPLPMGSDGSKVCLLKVPTSIWESRNLYSAPFKADKTWTIRFNASLDKKCVNEQNFYLGQDNIRCKSIVKQLTDNSVEVSPEGLYESGKYYTLCIRPEVRSVNGTSLAQGIQVFFRVE